MKKPNTNPSSLLQIEESENSGIFTTIAELKPLDENVFLKSFPKETVEFTSANFDLTIGDRIRLTHDESSLVLYGTVTSIDESKIVAELDKIPTE